MERGVLAVAMVALAAAGCLQAPLLTALPTEPALPAPETFADSHDGCTGYLLAMLIDPVRTDAVLPPGFHLRDPREFLRGVGTGQALLLVAATRCAPTAEQPLWRDATAAIFVQAPAVDGERPPADYDVYEVEHYSPEPAVQARLRAWGWPVANVSLEEEGKAELRAQASAFVFAAGREPAPPPLPDLAGDALLRFGGTTAPEVAVGSHPAVLRIWRETPTGLAHLDHSTSLPLGGGSGYCSFRPNSTLARLTGTTTCASPRPAVWEPEPALVATFALPHFHAVAVLQRGVHAQ
ncbi:MAG: hypothetical protein LC623_06035 [Halobacteriales archaeon]|nr:hypothetical protein [Halobacteriales archaeon]